MSADADARPQPREEEEPFSEGFWAGRLSDPTKVTGLERERAYQAYRAGERLNRNDGNRTPLQDRPAADARPPQEWEAPFLRAAIEHALTFHQTTHVHAVLRKALDGLSESGTAVPRRAEPLKET